MKIFTLYWRNGKTTTISGKNIANALNVARFSWEKITMLLYYREEKQIKCFCGGKFDKNEECSNCGMDLKTCKLEFG